MGFLGGIFGKGKDRVAGYYNVIGEMLEEMERDPDCDLRFDFTDQEGFRVRKGSAIARFYFTERKGTYFLIGDSPVSEPPADRLAEFYRFVLEHSHGRPGPARVGAEKGMIVAEVMLELDYLSDPLVRYCVVDLLMFADELDDLLEKRFGAKKFSDQFLKQRT